MKKIDFFGIDLSENERKTIISLIEIKHGIPKLVKKTLSEICKETNIRNDREKNHKTPKYKERQREKSQKNHTHRGYPRRDKGKDTQRGYQYRLLNDLITNKKIVEKDKNKRYFIKPQFLDLAYSSLIQRKIKDLEKTGLFNFLDSTVFGIKNSWLGYPEMHHFHESLVNALDSLYTIKMIKKIFLLRDFSTQWKSFLDSDIPLAIKYEVWKKIRSNLSFFDQENENKFLESQINILKSLGLSKKEIDECKKEINKHHNDFIVEFREKIGYHPEKYKSETNKNLDFKDESVKEFITKKLNKKQKKQVDNILNWCLNFYPKEINNTGFFLNLGNLNKPYFHFEIPTDYEEKLFRYTYDNVDFTRIESVLKNIEKNTIDNSLEDLLDIRDNRNFFRFFDRFNYFFVKLIQKPLYSVFYKQLDEKNREEIIDIMRKDNPDYSKDKTDYELFHDYALLYL